MARKSRKNMMPQAAVQEAVSTMCEEEKLVKDMMRSSNLDSARSIKMKENSILFRIQEAEERRLRLYEDYKAEILDEDEYSQLKEHYIAEKVSKKNARLVERIRKSSRSGGHFIP